MCGEARLPDFDGDQWAAMLPPATLKAIFAADAPKPRQPVVRPKPVAVIKAGAIGEVMANLADATAQFPGVATTCHPQVTPGWRATGVRCADRQRSPMRLVAGAIRSGYSLVPGWWRPLSSPERSGRDGAGAALGATPARCPRPGWSCRRGATMMGLSVNALGSIGSTFGADRPA